VRGDSSKVVLLSHVAAAYRAVEALARRLAIAIDDAGGGDMGVSVFGAESVTQAFRVTVDPIPASCSVSATDRPGTLCSLGDLSTLQITFGATVELVSPFYSAYASPSCNMGISHAGWLPSNAGYGCGVDDRAPPLHSFTGIACRHPSNIPPLFQIKTDGGIVWPRTATTSQQSWPATSTASATCRSPTCPVGEPGEYALAPTEWLSDVTGHGYDDWGVSQYNPLPPTRSPGSPGRPRHGPAHHPRSNK
jgi:hypothetical protein